MMFGILLSTHARALEIDWSGQFRADANYVHYVPDFSANGANNSGLNGYYIPGGGAGDSLFQTLFARLRPKIVVNDNTFIKSEFWLGDPAYGLFGATAPAMWGGRWYNSTQSNGFPISAQRLWAEFQSDFGTFQIGRMPLHWGLGVNWNQGDGIWDRFMSTGDAIRWVAKIGSFTLAPSFIVYSIGNSIGSLSGAVMDLSVVLKYENTDEDLDVGINLIKRYAGNGQDGVWGYWGPQGTVSGVNYLLWDLYAHKSFWKFNFSIEAPIVTGNLSGTNYTSFAVLTETGFKPNDTWETKLKIGYVPGQGGSSSNALGTYSAFYLNPSYKLGLLLFNYRFDQFAINQTTNNPGNNSNPSFGAGSNYLGSPYDAPITNALYFAATQNFQPWDKWGFSATGVFAIAMQTAQAGQFFFNSWDRRMDPSGAAIKTQGNILGGEFDLGAKYQWDEYFHFKLDAGILIPGSYFGFNNTATDNALGPLFGVTLGAGVNF